MLKKTLARQEAKISNSLTRYYYSREFALKEAINLINQNPKQKITLVFLQKTKLYKLETNLT